MFTFRLHLFFQKINLNIVTLCANYQIHFSQKLLSLTYDRVILWDDMLPDLPESIVWAQTVARLHDCRSLGATVSKFRPDCR